MVVEEGLCHVQQPPGVSTLLRQPGQCAEVRGVRLVRADVLRGEDVVELDLQPSVRGGEPGAVHVRQDDEPVVPLEDRKRFHRVVEGRPRRDGTAQVSGFGLGDGVAQRRTGATEGLAEGSRVEHRGVLAQDRRLIRRVRDEDLLVRQHGIVTAGPRSDDGGDPRLPVDEGAIAVEAQGIVGGEIQGAGVRCGVVRVHVTTLGDARHVRPGE